MKILEFPELRQLYEYDCGANALQSVLTYYGIEIREEIIMKCAKTNPKEGTLISEMVHTLGKFNLKYDSRSMMLDEVKNYINKDIPVIILLQAWDKKSVDYSTIYRDGHWVVAIGYNEKEIVFEDPYSFERTFLENIELEMRWHAKEKGKRVVKHGIAVFGKKPVYDPKKIIHMS